jgi:hypothetical protein
MLSTSEVVQNLVKKQPLLEDGLSRGIISYSALAREIKPQIEDDLMKDITRGSIVMALKRISKNLKQKKSNIENIVNFNGLTVRSDLVEFTYLNSDTIVEKYKKIFSVSEKRKDILCNLTQGVRETMLVVGDEIVKNVETIFSNERLISKINNLSSITVLLSKETVDTPGVYYSILKLLTWNNISFTDIISTYQELTIVFKNTDVDKAFSILKNYKNN